MSTLAALACLVLVGADLRGAPSFAQAGNPLAPPSGDDADAEPPRLEAHPTPGGFKPDPTSGAAPGDIWIFSGALQSSHETFSGTLVTGRDDTQFELKLANGATCDGADLKGEVGLVRLKEITCSDGRSMRALFVPQGGRELKVFGHVGEERFSTAAHILGTDPIPDKPQTAEPKGPLGLPPAAPSSGAPGPDAPVNKP